MRGTKATKGKNRRELILTVAAKLFREKGYEATTVRELADAVGLQSGSLFFHFGSKEEILLAVLEDGLRRALVILDKQIAKSKGPQERLAAIFHAHLKAILEEERDAFTVILREWRALSPRSRAKIVALRDEYESRIHSVLEELSGLGVVSSDVRVLRLFLLGALNWTIQWYRADGELSTDELADRFIALILPGERRRQPAEQSGCRRRVVGSSPA